MPMCGDLKAILQIKSPEAFTLIGYEFRYVTVGQIFGNVQRRV